MTKVTVDLVDLETIVFATAAIKTIEGALAARHNDPFVQPHLDFTEAHNRLATEMRNAKRADADTLVAWNGTLDDEEIRCLKGFDEPFLVIEPKDKAPKFGQQMSIFDQLAAKGCVEIGQVVSGVVWPGRDRPDIRTDPYYAVRMTQRGYDKLAEATK